MFVVGCATGLLLTDPAAPPVRATKDVDAIADVVSYGAYHQLSERLRERGFSEDSSDGAPICRWKHAGLVLDVMPLDESVLGFGNKWYDPAFKSAIPISFAEWQEDQSDKCPVLSGD